MSVYDDLREVAGEILTEFSQGTITHIRRAAAPNVYTPENPGVGALTETVIVGVVKGVTSQYLRDTMIHASDLLLTIPASAGIVPDMLDQFRINDTNHAVVRITPKPASGTAVVYDVVVRA
jgi:hypothetical protein